MSVYGSTLGTNIGSHHSSQLSSHEQTEQGLRPPSHSMHNQSMTVHTKQAMGEMNSLWSSPTISKS